MKTMNDLVRAASEIETVMAVCCGNPRDDELPQVAAEEDILMDVYSDILNMPREDALARFNHQYTDEYDYDAYIH